MGPVWRGGNLNVAGAESVHQTRGGLHLMQPPLARREGLASHLGPRPPFARRIGGQFGGELPPLLIKVPERSLGQAVGGLLSAPLWGTSIKCFLSCPGAYAISSLLASVLLQGTRFVGVQHLGSSHGIKGCATRYIFPMRCLQTAFCYFSPMRCLQEAFSWQWRGVRKSCPEAHSPLPVRQAQASEDGRYRD
jgi:hypothetical protein